MKILNDILKDSQIKSIRGDINIQVEGLCFDSRKLKPGEAFIAIKGTQTDGHLYIKQALESGAAAIVYENPEIIIPGNTNAVLVENASEALGLMASAFYDNPSGKLNLIGVTGTNGKISPVKFHMKI